MNYVSRMKVLKGLAQLHEQANYLIQVKWLLEKCSFLNRLVQIALFVEGHHDEISRVSHFKIQETRKYKSKLNV